MSVRVYPTPTEFEALREKLESLKRAFDLLDDHVVITDANGVILYANKAVERNTGYSLKEALGKNPGDLWGGGMPKDFYEKMWEQIKRFKIPYRGEVENKNKDGDKYWQELRIYPLLDDEGEIRFFIGVEPDITLRKTSEMVRDLYVEEMERFLKYMGGREVKIKELTEEVSKLRERLQKS